MINCFHQKINEKNEFDLSLKEKSKDNKNSLMWGTYEV